MELTISPRILAYAMLCHECIVRTDMDAVMRSLLAADRLYWVVMSEEERDDVLREGAAEFFGS